jgi:hypothetical protein
MKLSKLVLSLAGAALLLCSGAVASENNKGTLRLSDKVSLEGKVLAPGTYKVEWQGSGPSVQVTILKDKETVATFSARLSDLTTPSRANAYGTESGADGSRLLTTIYFGGKKFSLQVEQKQAGQSANSQPAN